MFIYVNIFFIKIGVFTMINYSPLFETLKSKGMYISKMREKGLHPTTIAKINRNESISLEKVALICKILDVPIEKVVKIEFDRS